MHAQRTTLIAVAIAFVLIGAPTALRLQRERSSADVTVRRLPNGGLQPEIVRDGAGTWHLLYFAGEPSSGDLFYVRSKDEGATFTSPVQVNSQPGSAIATGTIRGGQLAVGRNGRVHVTWNGSGKALPKGQFLYARLNDAGNAFEPQRGLMQRSTTLDGGGSIAADSAGNVYAAWHGNDAKTGNDGEGNRRVWIARSSDDGRTFSTETPAWNEPTGACGCCGMRLFSRGDALYVLYRSATASINRDVFLLTSSDKGQTFAGSRVHEWDINACPMTSMSLASAKGGVVGAWETNGQVYFSLMEPTAAPTAKTPTAPAEDGKGRKHPRLAVNRAGAILLIWTEGTSWARGGSLGWQVFNQKNQPTATGEAVAGVPVWSFAAAVARRDEGFTVFY